MSRTSAVPVIARRKAGMFGAVAACGRLFGQGIVLAVLMTLSLVLLGEGAPGNLDPTFGVGGKVTTDLGAGSGGAQALVLQPDGKLVAAGSSADGFGLARYEGDESPLVLEVVIDIKPGSDTNRINPKSHGKIPVAILTTESFDATTVDPLSVRFGPHEAKPAHKKGQMKDVNHDGEPDLVLHFHTQATGIQCGDTSATLIGETLDGDPIQGSDSIQTVGCQEQGHVGRAYVMP